ncbi:MAG: peptide ABC transporter ATP-binding protein, partial [Solobacterium sp.]|nr:peptide ABC transporter ATP-binding protein [Solobacterium sp.]
TRSLLSAIPHPNPVVEKNRIALTYDKNEAGVDYSAGILHKLTDTHSVLATDEEFIKWQAEAEAFSL